MGAPKLQSKLDDSIELTYWPHLLWMYYGYLGSSVFFTLLGGLLFVTGHQSCFFDDIPKHIFYLTTYYAILPVTFFLMARFFIRPLAFVKINLLDDKAIFHWPYKKTEFRYENVGSIQFAHAKNLGGWFKIVLKDGQKLRCTVVLKRAHLLLAKIWDHNPDSVSREKMEKFAKTSIVSDLSFGRIGRLLKEKKLLILGWFLGSGTITAGIVYSFVSTSKKANLLSFISFAVFAGLSLVVYCIGEFIALNRYRKQVDQNLDVPEYDEPFERKLLLNTMLFSVLSSSVALYLIISKVATP